MKNFIVFIPESGASDKYGNQLIASLLSRDLSKFKDEPDTPDTILFKTLYQGRKACK
jgi:hypothetical protein